MTRYVGIMTGTSMDGIDVAPIDFAAPLLPASPPFHAPMPEGLRSRLMRLQGPDKNELAAAAQASCDLADACAQAVNQALQDCGWLAADIAAIGLHGQTVRHQPDAGWTVQLANGSRLAELAGIDVVCDFRSGDIARGGQGAPLAPAFHAEAFAAERPRTVINLGGMANATLLGPGGTGLVAYDTGPGCALLDGMAERHLDKPFDPAGRWAASGEPDAGLLERMLAHPHFSAPVPKSCGREKFNMKWVDKLASGLQPLTVMATLLELTARTAADAALAHRQNGADLVICGGGARNEALMQRIGGLVAPMPTVSCASLGCKPEWVEPAAFAYFAKLRMEGRPLPIAWATGASADCPAGAVYAARR